MSELVAGDVLLCYSQMMEGAHPEMDGYSHVAMCIGFGTVLSADESGGVVTCSASDLLETYDHLAVMRSRGLWDSAAVERLQAFAAESAGKPFNRFGMLRVPSRQTEHGETVMRNLDSYFTTGVATPSTATSYFCSQLVGAAFISSGVIGESASIVLKPEIATPRGISLDAVYGQFLGYLTRPGYKIPVGDRFEGVWGRINVVRDV